MPHITVEYTSNLESDLSPAALIAAIHETALDTGVFPLGGLRTRAERRDLFVVADGNPENAFIAIVARIGEGRDADTRKRVADALMTVLRRETETAFRNRGLALSVDIEEIDSAASIKHNNLHERLASR